MNNNGNGTIREAIEKTKLERGLITEINFKIDFQDGSSRKEKLLPIKQSINGVAWNEFGVRALNDTLPAPISIENTWNSKNSPTLMCFTDNSAFGIGFGTPRPEVSIMEIKVLYPDLSTKEKSFCSNCDNVVAMGWTDKTVNVLKDALSPTSSETLLEELWNPGDWRDRCTLVQFIGSGEARCGCWCMDCEMGGGCACGHC